jgi:protein involved in polysaccharide export with SLBB domain
MRPLLPGLLCLALLHPVARADDGVATEGHRLQAGDVVRVVVPGLAPFADLTLDPRGAIDLGRLGVVDVAGRTSAEASTVVATAAARALVDVGQVEVTLVRRGLVIEVTGLVARPGLITPPVGADVWEGLAAAGGVVDGADLRVVQVRRRTDTLVVDVRRWLDGGGPWLPALETGDIVFVPARAAFHAAGDERPVWQPSLTDDVAPTLAAGINVVGGVVRPGRMALTAPLSLLDVLALAGGPAADGDLRQVTLVREVGGLSASSVVDLSSSPAKGASQIMVHPGDTVIVARREDDPVRLAVQALANVALIAGVVGVLIGLLGQGA